MRAHVDVLGWLFTLAGVIGAAVGLSLLLLALGTEAAVSGALGPNGLTAPTIWLLTVGGLVGGLAAAGLAIVGGGLRRRCGWARDAALAAAVLLLVAPPFGTALGVYAIWTLMHDESRREFGRRRRAPDTIGT
jgi:hypothetical protein